MRWARLLATSVLAGCVLPPPVDRAAPPSSATLDKDAGGFTVIEAPRGDGMRHEPPRIVLVVDMATGDEILAPRIETGPGDAAQVSADGYLPATVTARWPGPVALRRGTWIGFEARSLHDALVERRGDLVDPATHRWSMAPDGFEPIEFGVADLRAGNETGSRVIRLRGHARAGDGVAAPARYVQLTLAPDGLPAGAEAWVAAGASEWRVEPGRPAPVPAGVPLTLRVRDAVSDRTMAMEPLAVDAAVAMPPGDPAPPNGAAPPGTVAVPAPRGTGGLVVSVRDARGRFLVGSVSLDGHEPRRGARSDFSGVSAGSHRLAVWADGHEALVVPAGVEAGGTARVTVKLRPLPAR